VSREVVWHHGLVTPVMRRESLGWSGATIWLTGLSGSGKSTIATHVEQMLVASVRPAYILDGDNLRTGLNADLGFSDDDRRENIRRVGEVARLMADSGVVVLVPVISPFRDARDSVREMHQAARLPFFEVFVDTPLEECERRDPKGMYERARRGDITNFTGIDSPYEPPLAADLVVRPSDGDAVELSRRVCALVA
jgi:bifunctional enzyme CysN/CysC